MDNLIKQIKALQKIKPQSDWKKMNRDFLMSQIKNIQPKQNEIIKTPKIWQLYAAAFKDYFKEYAVQPSLAFVMIMGLVIGSSLTVNAAFYSLPGDRLYTLKIGLEHTQLALITNSEKKTELKIEFAKKRVDELDKIVAQTESPDIKKDKVNIVVKQFRKDVISVKDHISGQEFSKNPTFKIAISVDSATTELAQKINATSKELPPAIREGTQEAVDQAVDSAETTGMSALVSAINSISTTTVESLEDMPAADLIKSLNDKIAVLEDRIADINKNLSSANNEITLTPEIKKSIEDSIKSALALIVEAKKSLEANKYEEALAKITQIKSLIKDIEAQIQANTEPTTEETPSAVNNDKNTTTTAVLAPTSTPADADAEVETTKSLIK